MSQPRRGAAVLGVLAVALLSVGPRLWNAPPATPRDRLVRTIGDQMPFTARLSGGFAPPKEGALRGATDSVHTLSPDARIALAETEKRGSADLSAEAQADLAVAYLIQGDADRAIRILRDVAAQSGQAAAWNDLSAAYLVKGVRTPACMLECFARALEAAATANAVDATPESRFNEMIALQGLAPMLGDAVSWEPYLQAETDARWAALARRVATAHPALTDPGKLSADRIARLRAALELGDPGQVEAIVRESPETAFDYFNRELVPAWAQGVNTSDRASAARVLPAAILLAGFIQTVTGDPTARREAAMMSAGDPGLAAAHQAHAAGFAAYTKNAYDQAKSSFDVACEAFRRSRSNYADWAEFYLAVIAFQERQLESADARLTGIERRARLQSQRSLLAESLRMHGLVLAKQWRVGAALTAFQEAASLYEQSGQRDQAVGVYHHLADTYRTLGDHHLTWQYIARTLEAQSSVRTPIRRYLAYYNASLFASSQQLHEIALRLQSGAVREAMSSANDVAIVDALTQRALVLVRRGNQAAARADLESALTRLAPLPPGALKQYLQSELAVLGAEVDPGAGENGSALEDAIAFFTRSEPGRTPRLWLALARQRLTTGARDRTIEALEQGIQRLELHQAAVNDDALKISFFDDSWALFEELLQLQLAQKDFDRAFVTAERSRSRLLRSRGERGTTSVIELKNLQESLPENVAVIYYVSLPESLATWVVSRNRQSIVESRITASELGRAVARYREAIVDGRDSLTANDLYQQLITPLAAELSGRDTLVIVPDGALQQLPFATLRHPGTGRYLVEDFAVLIAPSATVFSQRRESAANSFSSALLIGNPATAAAALPGAEREAREVARFYRRADVLAGRSATKEQFVRRAPLYEVVHFGGHGFANAEYPLLSRLAFAGDDGQEDPLFAHEIAPLEFANTRLVVLAACSTAGGAVSRGEGVVSVAWPFLAAGVPQVIASQWDVDDTATHALFVAFHRSLQETQDAVQALRAAQLSLIRSSESDLAAPASWGAFVALGTLNSRRAAQ
jgi:CHAT domain-containing protein